MYPPLRAGLSSAVPVRQAQGRLCGTHLAIVGLHAHTKAPEVRFSNRLWLRPIGLEKRTSAAKAVQRAANYGTAEPVPFVKSLFSHLAKALTNAEVVP
jgi:hypothetical protein